MIDDSRILSIKAQVSDLNLHTRSSGGKDYTSVLSYCPPIYPWMSILADTPVVWNPTAWGWPYVGMQMIMRVMFDACLVTDGDSSDWWDQFFR